MVTIYGLQDPITGELRYIGRTARTVAKRLYEHIKDSKKLITHKDKWIQSLLRSGRRPELEVRLKMALAHKGKKYNKSRGITNDIH